MWAKLFQPPPEKDWADQTFSAVTAASRCARLYGEGRTPDTFDGRFELLVLHAAAVFLRLKAEPEATRFADAFADRFFQGLDDGLREEGVGDFSIPRRMRALAGRVYGRIGAYERAGEDKAALAAAVARNVFNADAHPFAPELANRLLACRRALTDAPLRRMAEPATWP